MYHRNRINLIYRVIAFLLLALTILFINNAYIVGLITICFIFFERNRNMLLLILLLITLLLVFPKFFDNGFMLGNIMLAIDFLALLVLNIDKNDLLMTKQIISNKLFTYDELYKKYNNEFTLKNNEVLDKYIEDNKIEVNDRINEIRSNLVMKSKNDANDMIMVNYLRFYKNRNDIIGYLGLNRDTIIYLGAHVIILLLVMVIEL